MPDWFYRTVSRPVLFRLPGEVARDLVLGFMGRLARLPLGPHVIDFLGHMRPPARLASRHLGMEFPSPVGLGLGIDEHAVALPALARFGVGFVEVGPVAVRARAGSMRRRVPVQAVWYSDPPLTLAARDLAARLPRLGMPAIVRIALDAETAAEGAEECRAVGASLGGRAAMFTLPLPDLGSADKNVETWRTWRQALDSTGRPIVPCVGLDTTVSQLEAAATLVSESGAIAVDGSMRTADGRLRGSELRAKAVEMVTELRQRVGPGKLILAGGGVHEPADAVALREAGADLVTVDSGLVFSGPGLPKRINEALLAGAPAALPTMARPAEQTWFWTLLLGIAMLLGGVLAVILAMAGVLLPYDEAFLGMTGAELTAINDRLLLFMAHDRVSLAGTMVSIAVLYLGLSWFGIRRGAHWAKLAVLTSAFTGFGSFFLFLCFGYFDPFHAFVTAILFQFVLLAVHSSLGPDWELAGVDLREDAAWRRGQWGQLLFVVQGCGLLGAGAVIASIGATVVFVHEDLEFMQTTAAALSAANPRLVPLVAHDRATFGGMLLANGVVVLLVALWGFRRGRPWLWWTLLLAGTPAYLAGIGVHLVVGYTSLSHLAPVLLGAAGFVLALALSHDYLCKGSEPAVV